MKLSGLRKAGLPPDFLTVSSPAATNISDTPKSHSLTTSRSAESKMLSGLIWYQLSSAHGFGPSTSNRVLCLVYPTHIPVNHAVEMQVLQPKAELPEVLSRLLGWEWRCIWYIGRTEVDIHEHAAGEVLEDEEEGVLMRDRYGFVEVDELASGHILAMKSQAVKQHRARNLH